jgi:hypothetical protein
MLTAGAKLNAVVARIASSGFEWVPRMVQAANEAQIKCSTVQSCIVLYRFCTTFSFACLEIGTAESMFFYNMSSFQSYTSGFPLLSAADAFTLRTTR